MGCPSRYNALLLSVEPRDMSIETVAITDDQTTRILALEEGHFLDIKGVDIQPSKLTRTISTFSNATGCEFASSSLRTTLPSRPVFQIRLHDFAPGARTRATGVHQQDARDDKGFRWNRLPSPRRPESPGHNARGPSPVATRQGYHFVRGRDRRCSSGCGH